MSSTTWMTDFQDALERPETDSQVATPFVLSITILKKWKNRQIVAIIVAMAARSAPMTEPTAPAAHTMFLGFQAENVRSFRDRLDFSLEATAIAEPDVVREIPWRIDGRNYQRVLPVAGVFGANASGKSTLLRTMEDMRRFVRESYTPRSRHSEFPLRWLRRPFKLDPEWTQRPSTYEIDLIIGGIRYEYGFTVNDEVVLAEWARRFPHGKAQTIFERSLGAFTSFPDGRSPKGRAVKELLRDDALVLSIADAAEYEPLRPLYKWFDENFRLCDASSRDQRSRFTAELMKAEVGRLQVLELLQLADLGITDAQQKEAGRYEIEMVNAIVEAISKIDLSEMANISISAEADSQDSPSGEDSTANNTGEPANVNTPRAMIPRIMLSHRGSNGSVAFDTREESLGTLVWLGLIGPLLDAIGRGTVLLVDELEASLHPLLVEQFVRIFQSPESNPNGAQLIFNSHEARLLGNSPADRVIGRDQAWFTEKMDDGATRLYPLAHLNPRKSEAVARRYMEGRYGATPILSPGDFTALAAMFARDAADS